MLDAAGAPGTVITGAPCHWSFEARFLGKAAHAGVAPEEGVSAIAMAAAAVEAMPLGRIDEATTANVGAIGGGRATNVVPDACMLSGECRSLFPERADAQKAAMTAAAGLAVRLQHDGGGSDANVLCAHGVRAVALGVGMAAFHSTDEQIAVADLEGSARLVEALITQAARS